MRLVSVSAIAVTLGAAIYVHYNALLVVIPILIGELAYTIQERKIDFPVLIALGLSGIPILISLPHIHAIHAYSKTYWSHITFDALFNIYLVLATKFIVIAFLAGAAFAFWVSCSPNKLRGINVALERLPAYELAAAGGYLLLPVAGLFSLYIPRLFTTAT